MPTQLVEPELALSYPEGHRTHVLGKPLLDDDPWRQGPRADQTLWYVETNQQATRASEDPMDTWMISSNDQFVSFYFHFVPIATLEMTRARGFR